MRTLILSILLFCFGWNVFADGTPTAPASQTEVNAGTLRTKFVSPATLAASIYAGGPTNGVTSNNVRAIISAANLTNWVDYTVGISNAMFSDIQSALNAAVPDTGTNGNPKGYKIHIGPGVFNSNGPPLLLTNRFDTCISIEGAGNISTVIHAKTNVIHTTGNLGSANGARAHIFIKDVALISDQNTTNPIVRLDEAAVRVFENVYFSYNGYITNAQWGISTAPSSPDPVSYPKLCFAVDYGLSNENNTRFINCNANGLAAGLYGNAAHLYIDGFQFQDVGLYNGGTTNGWAKTDPRASGAALVMANPANEFHIRRCTFVNCRNRFCGVGLSQQFQFYFDENYTESGGDFVIDDQSDGAQGKVNVTGETDVPLVHKVTSSDYTTAGVTSQYYTYAGWIENGWFFNEPIWVIADGPTNIIQVNYDHSITMSNTVNIRTLTSLGTASITTNTANFTIVTSDIALNALNTNRNQRAWVQETFTLTSTNGFGGFGAQVRLMIDQDANGSYETSAGQVGLVSANNSGNNTIVSAAPLGSMLQPNARFYYTNSSAAPGTAAVLSGTAQLIYQ